MSRPVEVARYPYRHQADMAAGFLEDAGIDAVVVGDDAGGMYPGILGPARIVVAEENAGRAREVLADLDEEADAEGDGR
ncbi:MAG: DUF2007 domain-containing protein [Gemmatimonadetes bacterium]|nr:DUF2007 domain-containing protein [Gemmatimonadota bacterium]